MEPTQGFIPFSHLSHLQTGREARSESEEVRGILPVPSSLLLSAAFRSKTKEPADKIKIGKHNSACRFLSNRDGKDVFAFFAGGFELSHCKLQHKIPKQKEREYT